MNPGSDFSPLPWNWLPSVLLVISFIDNTDSEDRAWDCKTVLLRIDASTLCPIIICNSAPEDVRLSPPIPNPSFPTAYLNTTLQQRLRHSRIHIPRLETNLDANPSKTELETAAIINTIVRDAG